jgi:hypothetical protein
MTDLTISQSGRSVDIHVNKFTRKIQKKWTINPIAVTSNRRATTYVTTAITAGATSLSVGTTANFQAGDAIQISGAYGTEFYHEIQTISSVSGGNTINLEGSMNYDYDSSASVIKLARFITFDFNQITWQIIAEGYLNASSEATLEEYATDLEIMTFSGGTVAFDFDKSNAKEGYENVAITSLIIEETPEDPKRNYKVHITGMATTKETGT